MKRNSGLPLRIDDLRCVLLAAAAIVRELYEKASPVVRKADGSPLTQADTQTNVFLQRELSRLIPTAAWLSEESADDSSRQDRDWVWIVDPLDGTKEFVRAIPEFAVSVGLVRYDRVVAGGVVNPITGEGGVAAVGGEVHFWGMTPRAVAAENLAGATACVSRSEVEDGTVVPYLNLVGTTRPVGSVAYKLLRVAAGVDDLTFSVQPKSEWDICGGVSLLVAGGKVYRRFDGQPLRFNQSDSRIRCGAVAGTVLLTTEFIRRLGTQGNVRFSGETQ